MKSVYIHIPFCKTICSYCDFCKMYYFSDMVDNYLEQLQKEIENSYKGEIINTIYIGGGTPSCLSVEQLRKLFSIIKIFKLDKNVEFTIECNVETLNLDKIKLFKNNGVNRVSIGVQSILDKNIKFLERYHTKEEVIKKVSLLKQHGINNINLDLIYALPNQTLEDLKEDLDFYLELDINHISTYSLMIEKNTKLGIKNIEQIEEELDRNMYDYICKYLKQKGFKHYEISNFCKPCLESKHNLVYWNNLEYYGFGVGASGYIDNIRYDNTRNISKYLKGHNPKEELILDKSMKIENEFILGFRKIEGISKKEFKNKYDIDICDIIEIKNLLKLGMLEEDIDRVWIPEEYLYVSNSILVNFVGGSYE